MGFIDSELHIYGLHYNCYGTACSRQEGPARATRRDVPPDLDIEAGDVIEGELEEIMREGWHRWAWEEEGWVWPIPIPQHSPRDVYNSRGTRNTVNTIRAREAGLLAAALDYPLQELAASMDADGAIRGRWRGSAVYCSECGLESHESYWVIWSETYCPECFNRLYPDQEEG